MICNIANQGSFRFVQPVQCSDELLETIHLLYPMPWATLEMPVYAEFCGFQIPEIVQVNRFALFPVRTGLIELLALLRQPTVLTSSTS